MTVDVEKEVLSEVYEIETSYNILSEESAYLRFV